MSLSPNTTTVLAPPTAPRLSSGVNGCQSMACTIEAGSSLRPAAALESTAAKRSPRTSKQVLPSGAVAVMSTTSSSSLPPRRRTSTRPLRVDEFAGESDAGHRGRNHQPRVVAVQQPGDVNCSVQQRNCRGLGQLDVGAQLAGLRVAGADRPAERTAFAAPGLPERGHRLVGEFGVGRARCRYRLRRSGRAFGSRAMWALACRIQCLALRNSRRGARRHGDRRTVGDHLDDARLADDDRVVESDVGQCGAPYSPAAVESVCSRTDIGMISTPLLWCDPG